MNTLKIQIKPFYKNNPFHLKDGQIHILSTNKNEEEIKQLLLQMILGDMGELGPQSDSLHASVGEHLKNLHVDVLVTIGTLSTALHEAAKKSAPQTRCLHFADVDSFLKETDQILKSGDAVLIKASHSMGFTKIVEALK